MRDILWLRVLTVISLGFEIPYFFFQPDPLWDGIGWDVAFIAINAYWIARLLYERRPVHFTDEQKRLYQIALNRLRPRHVRTLFKTGTSRSIAANERIATQGKALDEVVLIVEGKVDIQIDGQKVEEMGEGHFFGTASFLAAPGEHTAFATVVAVEPTRVITWKKEQLHKLIADDNELGLAIEASLGMEIAQLLARSWGRESGANGAAKTAPSA
ncbi:Crp/Fnr family transcriptional regulator [Bauldia sp.]|uniref:Crp/Fnr family transcriptional regulator n=1 Tax=Bauldia sp. TaxID=2575872 RepID=UPI003BACFFF1